MAGAGGGKGGANSELHAGGSETGGELSALGCCLAERGELSMGRSGEMRPKWSRAARTARTAQRARAQPERQPGEVCQVVEKLKVLSRDPQCSGTPVAAGSRQWLGGRAPGVFHCLTRLEPFPWC